MKMHSIYQGIWHISKQRILCNFFKLTDKFEKLHFTRCFKIAQHLNVLLVQFLEEHEGLCDTCAERKISCDGVLCVWGGSDWGAPPGRPDARACLCKGARAPAWPARGARTRSWPARSAHVFLAGRWSARACPAEHVESARACPAEHVEGRLAVRVRQGRGCEWRAACAAGGRMRPRAVGRVCKGFYPLPSPIPSLPLSLM